MSRKNKRERAQTRPDFKKPVGWQPPVAKKKRKAGKK